MHVVPCHGTRLRRRCRAAPRVLLALVAIGLGSPAVPAEAAGSALRRVAGPVDDFVSDGVRYAAWEKRKDSPITVFDSRTGGQRQISPPKGCSLANLARPVPVDFGGAAEGRFLLDCPEAGYALLDAQTGTVSVLPELSERGPYPYAWGAVGSLYVEGFAETDVCWTRW